MYKIRISIGSALLAFVGIVFYVDHIHNTLTATTIAFAIFTSWALFEFYQMVKQRGLMPYSGYGVITCVLFYAVQWIGHERIASPNLT